jgi:hypothetical protein
MKYFLLLAIATAALMASDATGKWTGTLTVSTSDSAAEPLPAYLVLKQDGNKLTGTAGPSADEQHAIEKGRAENGDLTFEVTRGDSVMRFSLKQEGEEIKGDVMREREGQIQKAKLAVRREQ